MGLLLARVRGLLGLALRLGREFVAHGRVVLDRPRVGTNGNETGVCSLTAKCADLAGVHWHAVAIRGKVGEIGGGKLGCAGVNLRNDQFNRLVVLERFRARLRSAGTVSRLDHLVNRGRNLIGCGVEFGGKCSPHERG